MRIALYLFLLAASACASVVYLLSYAGIRYPMPLAYFAVSAPFGVLLSVPCLLLGTRRLVQVALKRAPIVPLHFRGWLVALGAIVLTAHVSGILLSLELPFGGRVGIQISYWLRPVRLALYGVVLFCELRPLLSMRPNAKQAA